MTTSFNICDQKVNYMQWLRKVAEKMKYFFSKIGQARELLKAIEKISVTVWMLVVKAVLRIAYSNQKESVRETEGEKRKKQRKTMLK